MYVEKLYSELECALEENRAVAVTFAGNTDRILSPSLLGLHTIMNTLGFYFMKFMDIDGNGFVDFYQDVKGNMLALQYDTANIEYNYKKRDGSDFTITLSTLLIDPTAVVSYKKEKAFITLDIRPLVMRYKNNMVYEYVGSIVDAVIIDNSLEKNKDSYVV